jgi:hypothetical protein
MSGGGKRGQNKIEDGGVGRVGGGGSGRGRDGGGRGGGRCPLRPHHAQAILTIITNSGLKRENRIGTDIFRVVCTYT